MIKVFFNMKHLSYYHSIFFPANICQQIMKKLLMKKYRRSKCSKTMKPVRAARTSKVRDDLVYIFEDETYHLFQVNKISEDTNGRNVPRIQH